MIIVTTVVIDAEVVGVLVWLHTRNICNFALDNNQRLFWGVRPCCGLPQKRAVRAFLATVVRQKENCIWWCACRCNLWDLYKAKWIVESFTRHRVSSTCFNFSMHNYCILTDDWGTGYDLDRLAGRGTPSILLQINKESQSKRDFPQSRVQPLQTGKAYKIFCHALATHSPWLSSLKAGRSFAFLRHDSIGMLMAFYDITTGKKILLQLCCKSLVRGFQFVELIIYTLIMGWITFALKHLTKQKKDYKWYVHKKGMQIVLHEACPSLDIPSTTRSWVVSQGSILA